MMTRLGLRVTSRTLVVGKQGTVDDWRIDDGLMMLRGKIESLLPLDWAFYGPFKRRNGAWTVGVRSLRARPGGLPNGVEATEPDLTAAFRELARGIATLGLVPRRPN